MSRRAIDPDELRWRRREDARTLAEAERIKADKERYQGAILGAREIASEEIERVKGIAKVAGMKTPQTPKGVDPEPNPTTPQTPNFDKRGYSNPACIGKF